MTPETGLAEKELIARLSFSHIAELLAIEGPLERSFYENFRNSGTIQHMDTDLDLDALRQRDDFRALRRDRTFPDHPFAR